MKRACYIREGSITVFLSLTLLLILALLGTLLEGTRVRIAGNYSERALACGMDSLLTEYYFPLYEDYHLFFLERGILDEEREKSILQHKIKEYMSYSLDPIKGNGIEEIKRKGIKEDFYHIVVSELEIEELVRAIDYDGEIFIHEAVEYMKYRMLQKESFFFEDKLWLWQTILKQVRNIEKDTELEDSCKKEEEHPTNKQQSDKGSSLKATKGNADMLLELVVKDISDKYMDRKDFFFSEYKRKSNIAASSSFYSNISEMILFNEYVATHFKSFLKEKEGNKITKLEYEQEYLIVGAQSDKENLEEIIKRLLIIRTIFNAGFLLNEEERQELISANAMLFIGFSGVMSLMRLMQLTYLILISFAEALVDITALLNGKEIPIFKDKKSFMIQYGDLMRINKAFLQTRAKQMRIEKETLTLGYQDMIRILLLLENKKKTAYRAMDLIEENMRLRNNNDFSMKRCIFGIKVSAKCYVGTKFLHLPFIENIQGQEPDQWKLSITKSSSY